MKIQYLSLPSIGILVFALGGCGKPQQAAAPAGAPVVPVAVTKASQESIPTELHIVGTVEASAVVQIKSQVAGQLERVAFTEGQNVKQGDLLFVIDQRPFQEAVRQAEAAANKDRALITQLEATLARDTAQAKFAETDASRYAELQKAGVVSRSQSDQLRTTADATKESARATSAAIESARASLEADSAAIAQAKLNLSYTEIKAPISGRTGNLLVHAGNLVKVNDVPLVVIHQVAPMFVNFSVPEEHLATIRRLNAGRKLAVKVNAQDSPDRTSVGTLTVIDNSVDASTGTIPLKATFDNRDGDLWPGQFVNVILTLDTIQNATVVPTAAVLPGQKGDMVYVVKPDNKVEARIVKLGRTVGARTVIQNGLTPGDTVVIDGQMRLFPGASVRAVESPVKAQS